MIIIDADSEQWVTENRFDIAVPVHVEQNGEETKIFAYPSVSELCETYAHRFSDALFSDAAVDFLSAGCAEFCTRYGYAPDKHSKKRGYNFIGENIADFGFPCERIRRAGRYHNRTTYNLEACLAYGQVVFGVVCDGEIAAVAVTASPPDRDTPLIEIGVETAPEYRGKGYASAAARTLSAWLCTEGFHVLYKCDEHNLASAAVARNAGFVQSGRFFYYVLRKKR